MLGWFTSKFSPLGLKCAHYFIFYRLTSRDVFSVTYRGGGMNADENYFLKFSKQNNRANGPYYRALWA